MLPHCYPDKRENVPKCPVFVPRCAHQSCVKSHSKHNKCASRIAATNAFSTSCINFYNFLSHWADSNRRPTHYEVERATD